MQISVYSVNPYAYGSKLSDDFQTEKIVIQKLPLHINNSILDFLKKYPQVQVTSLILLVKDGTIIQTI